jgi:alpha-tubulin suppressor-like RCC1 family protein
LTGLTGLSDFVGAAGGGCAIAGGVVRCWGENTYGQLGVGDTAVHTEPVTVSGIADAVQIVLGRYHFCARRASGSVACWGLNDSGSLGVSTSTSSSSTPVAVPWLSGAVDLSGSSRHHCARLEDGSLRCWGSNARGELGGQAALTSFPGGTTVAGLEDVSSVAVGENLSCAVTGAGVTSCWGNNDTGIVGPRDLAYSDTPRARGDLDDVIALDVAQDACFVQRDGRVLCAGPSYGGGQARGPVSIAGFGSVADYPPVLVMPEPLARDGGGGAVVGYFVTSVDDHDDASLPTPCEPGPLSTFAVGRTNVSCSVTDTGGNTAAGSFSVNVIRPEVTTIDAGDEHACAVTSSATVKCWGRNQYGQLGNGTTASSPVPVQVAGLSDVTSVSAGVSHTCARRSDGTVWCWGNNSGRLGNGMTTSSSVPVQVVGVTDATSVSAGDQHTCAVLADGGASCWGGLFGTSPEAVTGISNAIQLSVGEKDTCAVTATETILCWSNSSGQAQPPVFGRSLSGVLQIGSTTSIAGMENLCALAAVGVWCWGNASYGQLGDGTTSFVIGSSVPERLVLSTHQVTGIAAGSGGTWCATKSSGAVSCWGMGTSGQLGEGRNLTRGIAVNQVGVTTASEVTVGKSFTCVRVGAESLKCSGANTYGQLGDGTTSSSNVPVDVIGL